MNAESTNSKTNRNLDLAEISIVLIVNNLNPGVINYDFLRYSGIVPGDLQLISQPVQTEYVSQLTFEGNLVIAAQSNRLIFSQPAKRQEQPKIIDIASKCCKSLPLAEYMAISINPSAVLSFEGEETAARKYITETLLKPGPWYEHSQEPIGATINYIFTLAEGQLRLTVSEARVNMPGQETRPAILFGGSIQYELAGEEQSTRLSELQQRIDGWSESIKAYSDIVGSFAQNQKASLANDNGSDQAKPEQPTSKAKQ
ncbi:hypothetical protein Pse7367_2635 [Thalassoporum mexicanum PCC 7367]|uniref:hypothetical protein n=1 Tax=Thalassoporum mexicanum TaxID=3457544 RepID=UPI00029FF938|nr:hypothetical protein [Pseudanabaena sp. PCC 7367]AFY70891.1 hypothetical protein Pse7367_2635 [Pseudanabaena sp. PCC 7367]